MLEWFRPGRLRVATKEQAREAAVAGCAARGVELREPMRVSRRLGWRPAWSVWAGTDMLPGGPVVTVDAATGEVLTVLRLPR